MISLAGKNILKNGVANILSKGVRIADQLLLVPFFLSSWGAEYYGEWLTLTIIPSVLGFSDLGFGSAASNAFVLHYSNGEMERASNIYVTALYVISAAVLLGAVLSAIAMVSINYLGLLANSLIDAEDAFWALIYLIISRLIAFYTQLYEAMFRARRVAHISTNINTAEGVVKICTGIAVLNLGYGILYYALSQLIIAVGFIVLNMVYAHIIIGKLPKGRYTKSDSRSIVRKGVGYLMSPIWQSIYFQGSTFAVRVVLGAESVAIFNTVRSVCRSVNQLFSIVNNSVFPELQYAIGSGNRAQTHKIFSRALQFVSVCALVGVGGLMLFGRPIYNWWTNNELSVPSVMWNIFMVGICLNAIWWSAASTFRATNKPYLLAKYGVISATISTLCTYLLATRFGLTGATMGYAVMDILMSVLILPAALKGLDMNWSQLFKI